MKRSIYAVIWHTLTGLLVIVSVYKYVTGQSNAGVAFPQKPIQIIVPFNPGGATDTFVRIIQKGIKDNDLMPQPLVVVNKEGGGTSIGSSYVADARNDGYTILCLHEALLTAKISGQSPHGPEAFEKVAATGEVGLALVVPNDTPYQSLTDLMAQAKAQPESVIMGVNLNTPTHYAGIMLENTQPDTRFRFVSSGGGANRLASLMGGHLDAAFFSVSEYLRFRENGLKAIAYMGVERHHGIPDVPTAAELGFPAANNNLQYWWFPKGTDPQIVDYFIGVLEQAMDTEYVQQRLDELKILPIMLTGEELQQRIDERMEIFTQMTVPNRVDLPNVVAWVLGAVLFFGLSVFRNVLKGSGNSVPDGEGIPLRMDLAAWSVGLVIGYILVMGLGILSFVWATLLFVIACGLLLTGIRSDKLVYVVELALLMSFGVQMVFTQVFSLSLP